jgi:NAD(P)-dependent dehydrogenase (short-subunit alcohol dehydrogenase family)
MFKRLDNLQGKVAVITGGKGQVGLATAQRLAHAGARIVLINRTAPGPEVLASLPNQELNHLSIQADVTRSDTLVAAAEQVKNSCGRCDILVNSAGITRSVPPANLDQLTDEMFDEIVTVNLRGVFATIRSFAPLLKASGDGLIVNISSTSGQCASPSNVAYGSAKAGIDLMTKTLGKALAPAIRVVAVVPGFMEHATSGVIKPPGANEKMAQGAPLARIGSGDDIACTVEALATHIRFATGSIILVDGGRTI